MSRIQKVWSSVTGRNRDEVTPSDATASLIPRALRTAQPPQVSSVVDASTTVSNETRAGERFIPLKTRNVVLTTVGGKKLTARIINVSRTGVALEPEATEFRPQDIVTVGSRPVEPGRRLAFGMVFVFKKPLDPKVCTPDLVL